MTGKIKVAGDRYIRILGILLIGSISIVDMTYQQGRCTIYAITWIGLIAGVDVVAYLRHKYHDVFCRK